MRQAAAVASTLLILAACGEQRPPTGVASSAVIDAQFAKGLNDHAGAIIAHDSCDPTSFNAVIGPGTCVKAGRTTFQEFIAELAETKTVRSWRFNPPQATAHEGVDVVAHNVGGEEHTFTPVREYLGGIVPDLNVLAGTPVVAPECANPGALDFVGAGEKSSISASALAAVAGPDGIAKVECCIHPWMRAEVRIK